MLHLSKRFKNLCEVFLWECARYLSNEQFVPWNRHRIFFIGLGSARITGVRRRFRSIPLSLLSPSPRCLSWRWGCLNHFFSILRTETPFRVRTVYHRTLRPSYFCICSPCGHGSAVMQGTSKVRIGRRDDSGEPREGKRGGC